jgi:DNA replication protein DnaC
VDFAQADLASRSEKLLKALLKIDLLILDDFAFQKIDQASSEYLYNLVDGRYGAKSIILTSNRAMTDWMGIFPDPVIRRRHSGPLDASSLSNSTQRRIDPQKIGAKKFHRTLAILMKIR